MGEKACACHSRCCAWSVASQMAGHRSVWGCLEVARYGTDWMLNTCCHLPSDERTEEQFQPRFPHLVPARDHSPGRANETAGLLLESVLRIQPVLQVEQPLPLKSRPKGVKRAHAQQLQVCQTACCMSTAANAWRLKRLISCISAQYLQNGRLVAF